MSNKKLKRLFTNIDTVNGICESCQEETILVAIVSSFYKCCSCGFEVKQHINGRIRYLTLDEDDKQWLLDNRENG
jgi:hypothetical protein|tara:strand:+ start:147 stop:371 length:225 start_codon:yes stop_codon:yes gene_type:complete